MEEDKDNESEKSDFAPQGEGYISLAEARVLAIRTAGETPGDYGRQYRGADMVFEAVESGEDDDYYNITLSFRPQGTFDGTPGQEQFVIGKNGTIAIRQILSSIVRKGGGFPVVPVAIGLAVVGAIVAAGFGFAIISSGGDSVPIAAVTPTETPGPTQPPAPTFTPTPRPTATPTPRPTATPTPRPTATPTPRPRPTPTRTPRPRPTPTRTPIPSPTSTPVPPDLHGDTLSCYKLAYTPRRCDYATLAYLDSNENPAAILEGRIQTKFDIDNFEFWISDTRKGLAFTASFLPFKSAGDRHPGLAVYNNYGNVLAITTVYSSGFLSFEPSYTGYYYLAINSGYSQKTSKYRVLIDLIAK